MADEAKQDLRMRIWSKCVCWGSFMGIINRNLFNGEMADFTEMEQAFNDFEAPIEAPRWSAD